MNQLPPALPEEETLVITRRLYVEPWQAHRINRKDDASNRMYNAAVKHYRPILERLLKNSRFHKARKRYLDALKRNIDKKDPYYADNCAIVSAMIKDAGLDEHSIQAWMGTLANRSYKKCITINSVQKLASSLYQAIRKCIFGNGKTVHYRKRGHTNTISEKKAREGIIYKEDSDTVSFRGMTLALKPIRNADVYLKMMLDNGTVRYNSIVRKPFKNGYKFFLQSTVKGRFSPKYAMGAGKCGIDPAMKDMAVYTGESGDFIVLARGIEHYNDLIAKAATKLDHRRRLANPENYNENGTVKHDSASFKKRWRWTVGMRKALFELLDAYRRRQEFVKNSHGYQTNALLRECCDVVIEDMDYKSYAKRAKPKLNQKTNQVERKRRFGRSITERAPSAWVEALTSKITRQGGIVVALPCQSLALSQSVHYADYKVKHLLSERSWLIITDAGPVRVQRDMYSSFLGYHVVWDAENERYIIDKEACMDDFESFVAVQSAIVKRLATCGDPTGNFGLKDFL